MRLQMGATTNPAALAANARTAAGLRKQPLLTTHFIGASANSYVPEKLSPEINNATALHFRVGKETRRDVARASLT
jgi:hypothetical protein